MSASRVTNGDEDTPGRAGEDRSIANACAVSVIVICKGDRGLAQTLECLRAVLDASEERAEVLVVDASGRKLDHIRREYPWVRWFDFTGRPQKPISIPEQRNFGVARAHGDVIVFTDAGCQMQPQWLSMILEPLHTGEVCAVGPAVGENSSIYDAHLRTERVYVPEAGTANMAITREALQSVGGFDEDFDYGSDVDLCWRLNDYGHKILFTPKARITHDFGGTSALATRSYRYGAARARLYLKHKKRLPQAIRKDPVFVFYSAFVLGLPLTVLCPVYPALLLVPLWRARGHQPLLTVIDHLLYGVGAVRHLFDALRTSRN